MTAPAKRKIHNEIIKTIKSLHATANSANGANGLPKLNARQKSALDAIRSGGFGCRTDAVTKLVSAIMGVDFSKYTTSSNMMKQFVVYTDDDDIGFTYYYDDADNTYQVVTAYDNDGIYFSSDHIRVATEEEINTFLNDCKLSSLSVILEYLQSDDED